MLNFLSKCAHVTQMLSRVPRKAGWVGVSSFLCGTSDSRLLQQVREKKKKRGRGAKDDEGWPRLESDSCIVQDFLLCRGSRSVARESWQSVVRSWSPGEDETSTISLLRSVTRSCSWRPVLCCFPLRLAATLTDCGQNILSHLHGSSKIVSICTLAELKYVWCYY